MMNQSAAETDDLLADFIDESFDILRALPNSLRVYNSDTTNAEPINAVFRAIHTIKGNAGFFGLVSIKQFAHALENTLDAVRQSKLLLSDDLARSLIEGFDLLEVMLHEMLDGQVARDLGERQQVLLQRIDELSASCADEETP